MAVSIIDAHTFSKAVLVMSLHPAIIQFNDVGYRFSCDAW